MALVAFPVVVAAQANNETLPPRKAGVIPVVSGERSHGFRFENVPGEVCQRRCDAVLEVRLAGPDYAPAE